MFWFASFTLVAVLNELGNGFPHHRQLIILADRVEGCVAFQVSC
jgi:hypothetical protein